MAAINETSGVNSQENVFGEVRANWVWILTLGIIFIILGTIGLGMTFALTLAGVYLFGILFLIGGGIQMFDAIKCKGWKGILLHLLMSILYVLAGIVIVVNPLGASMIFTLMIAGALIVLGVLRIIMAIQMRGSNGWIWPLIGGIISMVLGAIIFGEWPVSGLWVIGLFVAIELIVNGWSYIFIALAAKNAPETASQAGEGTQPAQA
jgi:uncharacterized membrane protein HdeD (DUF308 family)